MKILSGYEDGKVLKVVECSPFRLLTLGT